MTSQEFIYGVVIGVPVLIAFIRPFAKVSANVAELNSTIKNLNKDIITQENKVNKHSEEINDLKIVVTKHDTRLDNIEQRSCKYEEFKKHKGEWHE
ncbi:hypothetical protein [Peptostreptococcus stomatis]|jgi:outer membrane murein-binding lipoprotein Lpp|uniref:hypothetical protein n=1 Tax=Peptostreptococcus stomatis TaxID=341694 RepID=UPI0020616DD6|nr:hypothetical protein [Peptostreptococcus stomatis]DAK14593.1 MAG TPA: Protein of unknown function (DUF1043) [Caudoviricetes sp.]